MNLSGKFWEFLGKYEGSCQKTERGDLNDFEGKFVVVSISE